MVVACPSGAGGCFAMGATLSRPPAYTRTGVARIGSITPRSSRSRAPHPPATRAGRQRIGSRQASRGAGSRRGDAERNPRAPRGGATVTATGNGAPGLLALLWFRPVKLERASRAAVSPRPSRGNREQHVSGYGADALVRTETYQCLVWPGAVGAPKWRRIIGWLFVRSHHRASHNGAAAVRRRRAQTDRHDCAHDATAGCRRGR